MPSEVEPNFVPEYIVILLIADIFAVKFVEVFGFLKLEAILFGDFNKLGEHNQVFGDVLNNLLSARGLELVTYEPISQEEPVRVAEWPLFLGTFKVISDQRVEPVASDVPPLAVSCVPLSELLDDHVSVWVGTNEVAALHESVRYVLQKVSNFLL